MHGTITATIRPADTLLFTAISFASTTAVFLPLSRLLGRSDRHGDGPPTARPRAPRGLMAAMNVATAVTFLSFYVSLGLIEAATASALESAVGPVALIALSPLLLGRTTASTRHRAGLAALLFLLGVALAAHTFRLAPHDGSTAEALTGLGLAAFSGVGMATVSLVSRGFGDRGVSPVTVTAHRFHLTYLLATALWLSTTPAVPDLGKLATYAALGVVAVVVPLFLLQVGFQRADPLAGITVVATLPGVTYLVQLANGASVDPVTLGLLGTIMFVAVAQSRRSAG